jgi:hypothetical protein
MDLLIRATVERFSSYAGRVFEQASRRYPLPIYSFSPLTLQETPGRPTSPRAPETENAERQALSCPLQPATLFNLLLTICCSPLTSQSRAGKKAARSSGR